MKQFPIIGTTIFIIMVIVGLIIYKTREGYKKPKDQPVLVGPNRRTLGNMDEQEVTPEQELTTAILTGSSV